MSTAAPAARTAKPRVPKLGVGLAYQEILEPFIAERIDLLDFVEVVPDITWTDLGRGRSPRYVDDEAAVAFLRQVRHDVPVIPHSIGLSIGSAHQFDAEHVEQMARWLDLFDFPWHSDHLSYNIAEHRDGAGEPDGDVNVGMTLPLPFDRESVELVAERVALVRARIDLPFLLENNVYFFELEEGELDETTFLNSIAETSGCGLLLDLHNLYVNSRNHGLDPYAFLERLDLERVCEIHLGGGFEHRGVYLDAHSGPTPDPVWDLYQWVLPRCPALGGVVFELLGSWYEPLGAEPLADEMRRIRAAWLQHHPEPSAR